MSSLEAFFELNRRNTDLELLYHETPMKFVFINGEWKPRKKELKGVIARIHSAFPC